MVMILQGHRAECGNCGVDFHSASIPNHFIHIIIPKEDSGLKYDKHLFYCTSCAHAFTQRVNAPVRKVSK